MITPYQEQKSEQRVREEGTFINHGSSSICTTESGGFSPDPKQSDANHDPFLGTMTTKSEGIMNAGNELIIRTNPSLINNEGTFTLYYPSSSTQQEVLCRNNDRTLTYLNNQSSQNMVSMIQPTQGPTPASTPTQKLSPRLRSTYELNASQSRPDLRSQLYPQQLLHLQLQQPAEQTSVENHYQLQQFFQSQVANRQLERHQRPTTSFLPYQVPFLRYNQKKQLPISEEERQKRRLERNRIAAKQCRERKKVYVANLESKVTRLEEDNERLCRELTELNTKLLQHTLVIQEGVKLHMLTEELEARLNNQQQKHQSSRHHQKQSGNSLSSEDTV
ncbi:18986_t:CDS:2 [Funneliformis geosporum]|uniref:12425_t:CDS:1 n=1 Tax=Funneliformis geosporum TaxID=1117311 RepID=A0A9W4SIN0_9GLOM|nr:18986_t:CDS:2 [Funneliformis geosporum]CAI2169937.1 12425_t:CDS:2 [Funneliformis geosporum]